MSLHIKGERIPAPLKTTAGSLHQTTPVKRNAVDPIIARITSLISTDQYAKAIDVLRTAGSNPSAKNSLAVCLMRTGQIEEAVRILRALTLNPGSTCERTDVPNLYKRNFATALLLAGLPSGCVAVLRSTDELEHPRSRQIQQDIQNWMKTLSFWKRWDWKLNQVDPRGTQVQLSFTPGEFDFSLSESNVNETAPHT